MSSSEEARAPWNEPSGYHTVRSFNVTVQVEIPDFAVEVYDDATDEEIETAVRSLLSIKSLPSGAYISDLYIE